jgi:hypothetical protein
MRAVGLLLSITLVGCFPNNAKHRTYAKIGEGATLAAGITLLAVTHTTADCMAVKGTRDIECNDRANLAGTIGFGMILVGLAGFIATVSSTPDEKELPPPPPPLPVARDPAPAATAPTPAVPPAPSVTPRPAN